MKYQACHGHKVQRNIFFLSILVRLTRPTFQIPSPFPFPPIRLANHIRLRNQAPANGRKGSHDLGQGLETDAILTKHAVYYPGLGSGTVLFTNNDSLAQMTLALFMCAFV